MEINKCLITKEVLNLLELQKYMFKSKHRENCVYEKLIYLYAKNLECLNDIHICFTAYCEEGPQVGPILPVITDYCSVRPCLPLCLNESPITYLN